MINDFQEFMKLQNSRATIAKALELEGYKYSDDDITALNYVYEVEAYRIGSAYTISEYLKESDYGTLSERVEFARELWTLDTAND